MILHEVRCKTGLTCAINAKVRATKSHRKFQINTPDPPHWTLNSCFGVSHSVRVPFGLFHYCTKLVAKWVELVHLVQNFVPRSRIRIFRNERTRSTPLDPKLMFWCVSYRLGAFGTVRLPYKTRCKTGRTNAKVCATKSRRNFSQRTTANVRATKSLQNFSQRTHPIHPIWPQTDVFVHFIPFGHPGPFGCLMKLGG